MDLEQLKKVKALKIVLINDCMKQYFEGGIISQYTQNRFVKG